MQEKKCRKCKQTKTIDNYQPMNLGKYGVSSTCIICNNSKVKTYKISNKSKTNKNVPAKFSSKVKAEILLRDKHCLFCPNWIQDFHHIFYGWQAEYWEDRNNINKWVWLCRHHHELIHHFTDGSSQKIRQQCIDYVNNLQN